ncbi:DUF1462 family protein [Anaerobacillus sp. HL2]|nr:DUF1462 family protein [Anaerobacillus sp. HL2]
MIWKTMASHIIGNDLFYPVVVINEEIVAEENPKASKSIKKLMNYYYTRSNGPFICKIYV